LHQGLNALEKIGMEHIRQSVLKNGRINYKKIYRKIDLELEVLETLPEKDKKILKDDIKHLKNLKKGDNLLIWVKEVQEIKKDLIVNNVDRLAKSINTHLPTRSRKDLNGNIIR